MRLFTDVIGDIEGGAFADKLTGALQEVTEGVVKHRKSGELTIKLKVQPNGETSVKVTGDTKLKVPEPAAPVTVFFTTASGDLLRDNPNQPKLPFKNVYERDQNADEEAAAIQEESVS